MRRSATVALILAALALSACAQTSRPDPFGPRSGGYSYGGPGARSSAAEAALLRNQLMLERAQNRHRAARYDALIDRDRHGRDHRRDWGDRDHRRGWDRDHDDRARHERDLRRDRERRDAAERERARELRMAEQRSREQARRDRDRDRQEARAPRRSSQRYGPDGATPIDDWHRQMVDGSAR